MVRQNKYSFDVILDVKKRNGNGMVTVRELILYRRLLCIFILEYYFTNKLHGEYYFTKQTENLKNFEIIFSS